MAYHMAEVCVDGPNRARYGPRFDAQDTACLGERVKEDAWDKSSAR